MSGIFWILLLLPFALCADETSHPAFTDARQWAESRAPSVSEGVKQFNPQQAPGFTTSNPPETNYNAGNLSDSAAQMAATSEMGRTLNQNYQNRPSGQIRRQEEWLQKGSAIEQSDNPVQILTGHYTDCKTTTPVAIPQYQILTCDEFVGGEEKTCSIGQIVEVDAKHTYQCQSTRQRERLTCQKILNIQLQESTTQTPSCVAGRVIASTQGERSLSASIRCQIDSPTLAVDFVCGWRGNPSTHTVTVNGSGSLDFSDCKPRRRSGDTLGVLPYSLQCNSNERCTLQVSWLLSLSFDRPRTIRTVIRTPVDVWDNQCAALEGRCR